MAPILDKKDKKILHELDINARRSNNQIAKKTKLSKEVVKYRIDKLIREGVIYRFQTTINYFRLGKSKFKLYLRLTNANKEKKEEIAEYFKKQHKTEWVVLTSGRWDLISGFLVDNVNVFDEEVQKVINKFSEHIQEKAVTTTIYLVHERRAFLETGENKKVEPVVYHTSKDKQIKIDDIDEEILRILANNARIPVTTIAKKMKTTPKIIQYHIKKLENNKVILAYRAHLEPRGMNKIFCKAIIYLSNPTKKRLDHFINYTASVPGAVWPQRVMGTWDFELDLELDNYEEFEEIMTDLKEKFPDVIKNHEFCIVSKEFKLDFYPNCYPCIHPNQ